MPHPVRRRTLMTLAALATPLACQRAFAHHGWSSFDLARPLYLEGQVVASRWRNPHAELDITLPPTLALPANLRQRVLPAQSADVDGPGLLARTALPVRQDRRWELELAPLTRLQAWKLAEIRVGTSVAAIGYTFQGEQGDPILRVEYLFVDDRTVGLRSNPA